MYSNPDELLLFFDSEILKEASTETRIKGYKVKVEYSPVSVHVANQKKRINIKIRIQE